MRLLEGLSGERLLTKYGYANGGTVVFVRALWISSEVFILGLLVMNVVDPDCLRDVDLDQFRRDIVSMGVGLEPFSQAHMRHSMRASRRNGPIWLASTIS